MSPHQTLSWSCVALALLGSSCSSGDDGSGGPPARDSDVVFNELCAAGDEWVEIYNKGSAELSLGGYAIADSDETTGAARTSVAMRFPSGTKLAPGGFILILLGKKQSAVGPYTADACLAGAGVGCYYASFSISEARGEAIHFLTPDDATVTSTHYPANLAFEAGSGLTACRLPDGTGDLTVCKATPGRANAAD